MSDSSRDQPRHPNQAASPDAALTPQAPQPEPPVAAAFPEHVQVLSTPDVGRTKDPTFLEKWGIIFLAGAGLWILLASSSILIFFLEHLPPLPSLAGLNPEQAKEAMSLHKQLLDNWRDSLSYIFDLLVTKTALPVVTLLLGYLFGKQKS